MSLLKVSIIIVTYSNKRIKFIKKVFKSIENQSYKNIETIIVLNGAEFDIKKLVVNWANKDKKNRKVISFRNNIDLSKDNTRLGKLRYKKGIDISTGDLIFCQSDDDFVSNNFFYKMVHLFNNNKNCKTAIGLPKYYDWDTGNTRFLDDGKSSNQRKKYMHGKDLFINYLEGSKMFLNPGFCFVIKRELILKAKIWEGYDFSIFLSIVPLGITGFDRSAEMFWGVHEKQEHYTANIKHYNEFIYLKPTFLRNEYARKIWKKIATKEEFIKLNLFFDRHLSKISSLGFYWCLKNLKLLKAIRHYKNIKSKLILIKILINQIRVDIYYLRKKFSNFFFLK
jgi:glycosyltransferase involved in cell wall biosynthesis